MRIKLMTVTAATALAVLGFAPAASATCTDVGTGDCIENTVCAPLAVLNDLGIDANCVE